MNKNRVSLSGREGFASLISIIIIVVVIVAGYSLWKIKVPKATPPSTQPQPKQTLEKPEPKNNNETASWKTYQDKENGFEFKYPEEMLRVNLGGFPGFEVITYDSQLLKAYSYLENPQTQQHDLGSFSTNSLAWKAIALDGDCDVGHCVDPSIAYRILRGDYRIVIRFYNIGAGSTAAKEKPLYREILSTFKFTK